MVISIITVTYNSAKTVRDTFESVLSQTYSDIEYLVIDGASADNTVAIIKEFEPQFKGRMRWISEPDKGIYDAMNKGLELASGEVIMFLHSDDFFARQDAVDLVAEQFKTHPEAECVYANLYYVARKNTSQTIRTWRNGPQRPFHKGWMPAHPTFYCRSSAYKRLGYFDLNFRIAADFDLMLRFVEVAHIKMIYLPEFLVRMRLGGTTSSSLKNFIIQNRENIAAFRKYDMPVGILYFIRRFSWKIRQLSIKRLCGFQDKSMTYPAKISKE